MLPGKITDFCPHYVDEQSQSVMTQYDKDDVETIGLVKFDFLGLKTLTIISEAVSLVNFSSSSDLDINKIPLNDVQTFELYSKAKTMSVFQVESKGHERCPD